MPFIPDWAPSVHPLLVHFPISLLLGAAVVDLLGAARPASHAIRETATWLYCAGALMAMAAYFSGLGAAETVPASGQINTALSTHFTWADRTTWFFVFFASVRLAASYIWDITARWGPIVSFIVAVAGLALLVGTAAHGGRLVFEHGVGVSGVPSQGPLWTPPGRPPVPTDPR